MRTFQTPQRCFNVFKSGSWLVHSRTFTETLTPVLADVRSTLDQVNAFEVFFSPYTFKI